MKGGRSTLSISTAFQVSEEGIWRGSPAAMVPRMGTWTMSRLGLKLSSRSSMPRETSACRLR